MSPPDPLSVQSGDIDGGQDVVRSSDDAALATSADAATSVAPPPQDQVNVMVVMFRVVLCLFCLCVVSFRSQAERFTSSFSGRFLQSWLAFVFVQFVFFVSMSFFNVLFQCFVLMLIHC